MALPTTVDLDDGFPGVRIRAVHVLTEGRHRVSVDVHYVDDYVPFYELDEVSADEAAAYIQGLAAHYSHLDHRRDALVALAHELRNRK